MTLSLADFQSLNRQDNAFHDAEFLSISPGHSRASSVCDLVPIPSPAPSRASSFSSDANSFIADPQPQAWDDSICVDEDWDSESGRLPYHVHLAQANEMRDTVPLIKVLPALSNAQRWACVRQLIVGLLFLHGEGIYHGNVCVDSVVGVRQTFNLLQDSEDEFVGNASNDWVFKWLPPPSSHDKCEYNAQADSVAFGGMALEVVDIARDPACWREELLSKKLNTRSKRTPISTLRWLAKGDDKGVPAVIDAAVVECVLNMEGAWPKILDHAASRAALHRSLQEVCAQTCRPRAQERILISRKIESALQRDPFSPVARAALELSVWNGRCSFLSTRNAIVSLVKAGCGTPPVDSELARTMLNAGWLAEAWGFATYSLQRLGEWGTDWEKLASRITDHEVLLQHAGNQRSVGCTCDLLDSLAELLLGARHMHEDAHHLLRQELERYASSAVDRLSEFPAWPFLLLPPGMAGEAAKVAAQRTNQHPSPTQALLWHMASNMPTTLKPKDGVSHLLCSWPANYGSLGIHVVQPSGFIIWSEGALGHHAVDVPPSPSQWSQQIGSTACTLLAQQRLMVFVNHVSGDDGAMWETYSLRFSLSGGGITWSSLVEGSPSVLILLRADNTFDRFVLDQPRRLVSPSRSSVSLASTRNVATTPKKPREALVSTAVTLDTLLSALRTATSRATVAPKALGLIPVSDGHQFLVPLRFSASDIRVLVLEHSNSALGYHAGSSGPSSEIHLRAQQLHSLSLSWWPPNPATRTPATPTMVEQPAINTLVSKRSPQQPRICSPMPHATIGRLQSKLPASTPLSVATVPPDAVLFFLPHIWEIVLCLDDQLFWWTMPYPLNERAASGSTVEARLEGTSRERATAAPTSLTDPSAGTEMHYRVELPFRASHWQLVSLRSRLVALVTQSSAHGIPSGFAVVDAWYGDILRMVPLPQELTGTRSCAIKPEWQPPYGLSMSNNTVVVNVGGRVSFWSVPVLVQKVDDGGNPSACAKPKHAQRRLHVLRRVVRREVTSETVAIDHEVISSGGRDGWYRPSLPEMTDVESVAIYDLPCFGCNECLLLPDMSIWSTGCSLHALFHEDVEVSAQNQNHSDEMVSVSVTSTHTTSPAWKAVSSAPESSDGAADPEQPEIERCPTTHFTMLVAPETPAFTRRSTYKKKTRTMGDIATPSSSSRESSRKVLFGPNSIVHSLSTPSSRANSKTNLFFGDFAEEVQSSGILAAPGRRLAIKAFDPKTNALIDSLASLKRKLPDQLMRWLAVEILPTATWLVEALQVVSSMLLELRDLLLPGNSDLLLMIASALEACCRVAGPFRFSFHNQLQEIHRYLADCTGCLGEKPWTTGASPHVQSALTLNVHAGLGSVGTADTVPPQFVACGAEVRCATVLSSKLTYSRIVAVALDVHGHRMLLVLEDSKESHSWMIEFWRAQEGSVAQWNCTQQAHAHVSSVPPCCSLTDSAAIGFTAAECLRAWDTDDAEQLFTVSWGDGLSASSLWCSGDGARLAILTSQSIHCWKDRELSYSVDNRAILAMCDEVKHSTRRHHSSQIRFSTHHHDQISPRLSVSRSVSNLGREDSSIAGPARPAAGDGQITLGHCSFSVDASSILAGVVDNRWLAVIHLQHQVAGTKSTAYVLTHPSPSILGMWVSASGALLMMTPEKLDVWALPFCHEASRRPRHSAPDRDAESLERDRFSHAAVEDAFENLSGGAPEKVFSVLHSRRWHLAAVALLPVQRFLTFNEHSRMLICWDVRASAAVGFVIPTSQSQCTSGVLEPQWATGLPVGGNDCVVADVTAHGDLVALCVGMRWTLWSFSVNICGAITAWCAPNALEDKPVIARASKKRAPDQPQAPPTPGKRNALFQCTLTREVIENIAGPLLGWNPATLPPPLLPASTGRLLKPNARWLAYLGKETQSQRSKKRRCPKIAAKQEQKTADKPDGESKSSVPCTINDDDDDDNEGEQSTAVVAVGMQNVSSLNADSPAACEGLKGWAFVREKFGFRNQRHPLDRQKPGFGHQHRSTVRDESDQKQAEGEVSHTDVLDLDCAAQEEPPAFALASSPSPARLTPPLTCTRLQSIHPARSTQREHPCTISAGNQPVGGSRQQAYSPSLTPINQRCSSSMSQGFSSFTRKIPFRRRASTTSHTWARLGVSPVPPPNKPHFRRVRPGSLDLQSSTSLSNAVDETCTTEDVWREELLSAHIKHLEEDTAEFDELPERPGSASRLCSHARFLGPDGRDISPAAFPVACVVPRLRKGALGTSLRYYPKQAYRHS